MSGSKETNIIIRIKENYFFRNACSRLQQAVPLHRTEATVTEFGFRKRAERSLSPVESRWSCYGGVVVDDCRSWFAFRDYCVASERHDKAGPIKHVVCGPRDEKEREN